MKFNGIELKPGCIVKLKNKRGEYWNASAISELKHTTFSENIGLSTRTT